MMGKLHKVFLGIAIVNGLVLLKHVAVRANDLSYEFGFIDGARLGLDLVLGKTNYDGAFTNHVYSGRVPNELNIYIREVHGILDEWKETLDKKVEN